MSFIDDELGYARPWSGKSTTWLFLLVSWFGVGPILHFKAISCETSASRDSLGDVSHVEPPTMFW